LYLLRISILQLDNVVIVPTGIKSMGNYSQLRNIKKEL